MTTVEELAALVARMRAAQRAYYASRDRDDLIAAKQAEKVVDDVVKEILGPMGGEQ